MFEHIYELLMFYLASICTYLRIHPAYMARYLVGINHHQPESWARHPILWVVPKLEHPTIQMAKRGSPKIPWVIIKFPIQMVELSS